MAAEPDETPGRALLVALLAMAGVAVLVGLAIGGVVMSAVSFLDGGSGQVSGGGSTESLVMPDYKPTKSADEDSGLPGDGDSPSPEITLPSESTPAGDKITLFVAPQNVSPGERINFNGVYVDGEGVALQVQRREGGSWIDFPVEATVQGGSFETWIQTSQTGKNEFRVYDEKADRASNVVTVTIG